MSRALRQERGGKEWGEIRDIRTTSFKIQRPKTRTEASGLDVAFLAGSGVHVGIGKGLETQRRRGMTSALDSRSAVDATTDTHSISTNSQLLIETELLRARSARPFLQEITKSAGNLAQGRETH